MDYTEALQRLHSLARFGSKPGLERITALLERLGRPQDKVPAVHIAGTNGKGSVAALLSSICQAAGCRTGLFTSPHLVRYNERIRLDGRPISDDELADLIAQVWPLVKDEGLIGEYGHPTEFELGTALAFLCFAELGVDLMIIEVGLGGRLDATNVIIPEAAVITKIAMDHAMQLGSTLGSIAKEKAGIIKEGRPVVSGPQEDEAREVIARVAQERRAPLLQVGSDVEYELIDWGLWGTKLNYRGRLWREKGLTMGLAGPHQAVNGATALAAAEVLVEEGWDISPEAVREGLRSARWPGRFEMVQERPPVIFDGAHNPDGARALSQALAGAFPGRPIIYVMAVLGEKDRAKILEALLPLGEKVVFTRPSSSRSAPSDPAELVELASPYGIESHSEGDPRQALAWAMEQAGETGVVCICGSLYLVGELRGLWPMENSRP
jgi:dihydrofolate synthase/folylpolyglutamate synthase